MPPSSRRIEMETVQERKIKCKRCGHTWITKSTRRFVSCANHECRYKVDTEKNWFNRVRV